MSPKHSLRWIVASLVLLSVGAAAWAAFGRRVEPQSGQLATWPAPTVPDSPAGVKLAGYLEAFNSGSEERLTAFARENFTEVGPGGSTIEQRIGSQLSLFNTSRGLTPFRVHQASPSEIELVAQFRLTQEWRQMFFYVDVEAPHRINGIRIVPIDPPAIPEQAAELPLEESLDNFLGRLLAAQQFSGVAVIARNGEIEYARALGLADREESLPVNIDTPFHYASVGKMFTAVAVGQLMESGKLSLDDKLAEHLADYPAEVAQAVCIEDLLSHRSGIPDFFELLDKKKQSYGEGRQQDMVSVFANEPLNFKPGTKFEYSNSNFVLLGEIVERLSGQSYEDYLEEHVFRPAKMKSTTLDPAGRGPIRPAIGYTEMNADGTMTPGTRRSNASFASGRGGAAGGGVTTAADMVRFSQALRENQLISAETLSMLLEPQVDGPRPGEHYARGFILRDTHEGVCFGHSGGFPGVDAQFDMHQGGWTVVVLANYEAVGEPVARHIESLLLQKAP